MSSAVVCVCLCMGGGGGCCPFSPFLCSAPLFFNQLSAVQPHSYCSSLSSVELVSASDEIHRFSAQVPDRRLLEHEQKARQCPLTAYHIKLCFFLGGTALLWKMLQNISTPRFGSVSLSSLAWVGLSLYCHQSTTVFSFCLFLNNNMKIQVMRSSANFKM